jgi:uncharacterized protein YdaU (DUF1376 family)
MHYYKRNLGDYAKKAGRLSMLQHGSYTLLIDACYDRERFPTLEEAIEWTWASSTAEIEAVEFVLRKFFVLENGVYVQKRIQEEIEEYRAKSEINARIAKDRETKRAEKRTNRVQDVDESSPETHDSPPNQEPRTKNQDTSGKGGKPPAEKAKAELWKAAVSLLEGQGMPESQARAFFGKLSKDYPDGEIVLDAVRGAVTEQPADARAYLKATCQRLAGEKTRSGAPDWTRTAT